MERRNKRHSTSLVLEVGHLLPRELIADYCDRVLAALIETDHEVLVCDLASITAPDMSVIELLARMQLVVRRRGREIRLRAACPELRQLLTLSGLDNVLPVDALPSPSGDAGIVKASLSSDFDVLGQSE